MLYVYSCIVGCIAESRETIGQFIVVNRGQSM